MSQLSQKDLKRTNEVVDPIRADSSHSKRTKPKANAHDAGAGAEDEAEDAFDGVTEAYGDKSSSDFTIIKQNPTGKPTRFLLHRYELKKSGVSRLLQTLIEAEPESESLITLPSDGPVSHDECAVFFECIYQRDLSEWIKTISLGRLIKAGLYFDSDIVSNAVRKFWRQISKAGGMSLLESIYFLCECKLGERANVVNQFVDCLMPSHLGASKLDYGPPRITPEGMNVLRFMRELSVNRFIPEGTLVAPILFQFFIDGQWELMRPLIFRRGDELVRRRDGMGIPVYWINNLVSIAGMEQWAQEYRLKLQNK